MTLPFQPAPVPEGDHCNLANDRALPPFQIAGLRFEIGRRRAVFQLSRRRRVPPGRSRGFEMSSIAIRLWSVWRIRNRYEMPFVVLYFKKKSAEKFRVAGGTGLNRVACAVLCSKYTVPPDRAVPVNGPVAGRQARDA